MIPLVLVVGAVLAGMAAGWILRAETGRGRGGGRGVPAPPYDWAKEGDL